MCGIAGIMDLRWTGREPSPDKLHRMGEALLHRGPDEAGHFLETGLGLVHRRLSIVGLKDGRQPLFNEDGSVVTVCNGEIFDHLEQRAWLEKRGHVFRTSSDCEVVVHLYEELGSRFLERLRGQFAFALWDRRRKTLLLARDRMGIVPLHWAAWKGKLYFSSEIKGILAAGDLPARLDPLGLDHLFNFFGQPARRTCFHGISALPAGCWLKVAPRKRGEWRVEEQRYWDLSFPDLGYEHDPGQSRAVEEFGEQFENAVRLRLRAEVPVASYLSGGVDSTTVLAAAARQLGSAPPAFTIRIPTPGLDETNEALQAAGTVGARPVQITCDSRTIASSYPKLVEAAEAPVIDTSCAALLNLSAAVHEQGLKVALTGEGADEALAGYPWLKAGRILNSLDRGAFRPSNALRFGVLKAAAWSKPWRDASRYQAWSGGPNGLSDFYQLYAAARQRFYSPSTWQAIGHRIPYEDLDLNLEGMRRWHPLNRALYFGYKTLLPGMLLSHKGDRVAMRHSVETRYPFLDEGVVDYCARLHPRWKLNGLLRDKHVLRLYASSFLPASITERRKRIFRAPFAGSFFADPPPFATQLLSRESLRQTGLFDPNAVLQARDDFVAGRLRGLSVTLVEMGLTAVMATQLWHHLYLGGNLCELPVWTAPRPRPLPRSLARPAPLAALPSR